jgi:phospholipid/cholesterol/gamma-HCH transport system substrate-binding protein
MRENLAQTVWRLIAFFVVCLIGVFALLTIFAQLRFEPTNVYKAEFANVSGLENGNFVRVAGVEVGKVKRISIGAGSIALVEFSVDDSVTMTEGTKAAIRYADLIGGRYLSLEEGPGETKRMNAGATIPLDRTDPALDLDALIGGFRPLFRALNPDQVNALAGQLVAIFQGQGPTIDTFLAQTATLTNALADRDHLIDQVIGNLDTVLGSLGDQSKQLDKAVDSVSQLISGLAARKSDVSTGVAHLSAASRTVADLLDQTRPLLQNVVHQSDRATSIMVADHDYLDKLLQGLPDVYQVLARQGLYGDFFSFYLCDLILKVNGKGGQPVYVKLVGQSSGRCTPK